MSKFIIEPHFRLQEWIAEEKGYFLAEGLDYEFRSKPVAEPKISLMNDRKGVFQAIEQGRSCSISGGCHWTVNIAAAKGHGKLYRDAYSVAPAGVFVAQDSEIKVPADLAGVPIAVGYQSGSHYSTIQGLEQYMPLSEINLSFKEGLLLSRVELFIDGKVPAVAAFSGPYYLLEQLGYRKVIDTTFMMASSLSGDPDIDDIVKYFAALRRAQADLDLRPELYTHYYRNEFPARFHDIMDTRRWGPGERIVFEPYTKEIYEASQQWVSERNIFPDGIASIAAYEDAVVQAI